MPKTIVITGASAGIGAAVARRFAREGHRLVLAARRLTETQGVAAECERAGSPRAIAVAADVTCRADVEHLRDAAIDAFGEFDVWINNAGRGITRTVLELTDDDVDEMMRVNVKSALYGMQVAVPHFVARGGGHVINVSSTLGRVPLASFRSMYSASKAALNSLSASLRLDLHASHPDVHVSVVMPGVVTTDFPRNVVGEKRQPITGPGAGAQTPEEAAETFVALLAHPVPEVYTNPQSQAMADAYFADVAAFEARLRPTA